MRFRVVTFLSQNGSITNYTEMGSPSDGNSSSPLNEFPAFNEIGMFT
jgi:hypothetical protein